MIILIKTFKKYKNFKHFKFKINIKKQKIIQLKKFSKIDKLIILQNKMNKKFLKK